MPKPGTKFQRNYLFTVTGDLFPGVLQFGYPFTIEFDIKRDTYADANYAQIRLYNLSEKHRLLLLHDQDTQFKGNLLNVILNAGYGPGPFWPIIFKGNVTKGYSVREGVNWVTVLECADAGLAFANAVTNTSFKAGQAMSEIIQQVINSDLLPYGVTPGVISPYFESQILAKGVAFSGNTIDILVQLANRNFFIDNLRASILLPEEAIGNAAAIGTLLGVNSPIAPVTLNAQSGLLETPIREQNILRVKCLFEPRIVMGTVINLESTTAVQAYNGQYKVIGVHHRGTISAAVAREAITEIELSNSRILSLVGF